MAHGSLSQFKADLARKKAREYQRNNKFNNYGKTDTRVREKTEYNFPKLSESELEEVQYEIREKLKTQRRKQLLIIVSLFTLLIILIALFFWYLATSR